MLSKEECIHYFELGCKKESDFKIGLEHEQFVFKTMQTKPRRASYEEENGIKDLLHFFEQYGYQPLREQGNIIGLFHPQKKHNISLEPGGQFEFAAAPLQTLEDVFVEHYQYFQYLKLAEEKLNLNFVAKGYDLYTTNTNIAWMPKRRYEIMKNYMPKVGTLGLEMMQKTCTIQLNIDYSDEKDMIKKMRVALCLQPFVSAYFADSPHVANNSSIFKGYRNYIWQHTDNNRCGLLPFVFEPDFNFAKYVDYLFKVPLYFIKRGDTYHDVAGSSFIDFMTGRLEGFEDCPATLEDFTNHLTTVFPEVRLKQYIELRGVDGGNIEKIMHMTNYWINILYDTDKLNYIYKVTQGWAYEDISELYKKIPFQGTNACFQGETILSWLEKFKALLKSEWVQYKSEYTQSK